MDIYVVEPESESPSGMKRRVGRPRLLTAEHLEVLAELARATPVASWWDMGRAFTRRTGLKVSPDTLRTALRGLGFVRQQRAVVAAEDARKSAPAATAAASVETASAKQDSAVPGSPAGAPPVPRVYGYTQAHRDGGDDKRYPSDLTDAEWALVRDLFETDGPGKPPIYARRRMVDACIYAVRSGCSWRMLPKDFPPWEDVYKTFRLDGPGQVRGHARQASRHVA